MQTLLPDIILDTLASESREVDSMVASINAALLERANYERSKKPNGSHIELRRVANAFADNRRVAAFFVTMGIKPMVMFNKERKNGSRSNLLGLQRLSKMIDYVTGKKQTIDIVNQSLFAATIIAGIKGCGWISSTEQELILSPESIGSFPPKLRKAIAEYQHKHMTLEGRSRPTACEWRTTWANAGVYSYSREEDEDETTYELGINIDLSNPLITYLTTIWELN